MSQPSRVVPNHHAHHPGFAGVKGLVAALSMTTGREPMARLAIELTGLGAGERLVDVGCGPGAAGRVAVRTGAEVTGVDPAAVMLRVARLLDVRRRVSWVVGRAEELPAPASSADVVWTLSTIHHVPDIEAALREVSRVLRTGGRFLAVERQVQPDAVGLASHGWTPEQADALAELAERAAFTGVRVSTHQLPRGPVLAVTACR